MRESYAGRAVKRVRAGSRRGQQMATSYEGELKRKRISAEAADATPVSAALPVVCSTNHGTASVVNTLPAMERALAASRTISGRLTRAPPPDNQALGKDTARP